MLTKYKYFIILFITSVLSCEPLDLKRVMDTTTDEIEISGTSVVAHGTLLDVGTATIIEHGHCWSKNPEPSAEDTINSELTKLGIKEEAGEFSSTLFGIIPGQTHYIRSYAFDGTDYIYGKERSFEITAEDIQFYTIKIKTLDEVGSIEVTSSTDEIGSVNFNQHGHCWSQSDPPTISDPGKTELGEFSSDTSFTSEINDLTMGVYYVRGYLEAEGTVVYTNTMVYESTISVETGVVSVNPNSTAIAEGSIKSLGVKTIVDHGHCWSTLYNAPDINYESNSLGSRGSLGEFNSNIEGLISGRTYYYRAYAFDGSNFYYGDVKTFIAN